MTTPTNKPLVSILVWSDNRADMLAATLDSLLYQTYPNTELLVIDNASRDQSPEILAAYAAAYPGKLRYIRLQQRTSRTAAEFDQRKELRGEYITLASAGSRSSPIRITNSIETLITTPNLGGICSRTHVEDETGQPCEMPDQKSINGGDVILRRRLPREGNIIDPDSATFRRRFLHDLAFNPALTACGHLPLWLHILDDSELLRDNEIWIKHQRPADFNEAERSVAEAIQTVACIAQALRRWRLEQFFRFTTQPGTAERILEEAAGEAQLALQLVELDRKYFGRPAIGCHEAYFHALTAIGRAPQCLEAQQAMQLVRACLGDPPGPDGGCRSLNDWQAAPLGEIPADVPGKPSPVAEKYRQWQRKHALHDIDGTYFGEHMVRLWQARPAIGVLELPGPATPLDARLADQLYRPAYARQAVSGQNLGQALTDTPPGQTQEGSWLLLMPAGTHPDPSALFQLAEAINRDPGPIAWYADDEIVAPTGGAPTPRFKPDIDPLLLQGNDYLGALAIRLDALKPFTAFPLDASVPHRLGMALCSAHGRHALGHIPEVLFSLPAKEFNARQTLSHHLKHEGSDFHLADGPTTHIPWVARPLPEPPPSVSLIMLGTTTPSFDAEHLAALLGQTDYPNLELIYCGDTATLLPAGICLVARESGEDVFACGNRAARQATGKYLMFVGCDNVPQQADWLQQAVVLAEATSYGAVGVAGVDPDNGHLWGAGTIVGIGGGFDGLHGTVMRVGERGHLERAALPHECSAIAADGLLTLRELFVGLGGLDPHWRIPDVIATDYCLRLRKAGHYIAWTPRAALNRRRKSLPEPALETQRQFELRDQFIARWLNDLASDPYWNRHLSLLTPEPLPEDDLVFRWSPDYRDRLRVLALPMPASGQAEYRVTAPLRALDNAGLAQTILACEPLPKRERAPIPTELARLAPDTIYLQAAFDDVRFHGLRSAAQFNPGIFRIFSLDDRISDMPSYNASSKVLPRDIVMRRMTEALRCCNRLIVSTAPLAELYRHEIDDIVIVPNRLEKAIWGELKSPPPPPGQRPRVGWAGALQHAGDLAMIREVVETLAGEVDWIFFGMIPAGCEPFIKEFHGTVHLDAYPAKLASLALDLAVAPLEVNLFNESKSNLRLLEYGIFGWPVICTDIDPYRTNNAPVCRLPNDARLWIAAIREHLSDRAALRKKGLELQTWVRKHYLLEDHLDDWLTALRPN